MSRCFSFLYSGKERKRSACIRLFPFCIYQSFDLAKGLAFFFCMPSVRCISMGYSVQSSWSVAANVGLGSAHPAGVDERPD
jgi:hypothetical protein